MLLFSEPKRRLTAHVAVLVSSIWLVSACIYTGIPVLDATQAVAAFVFMAAGTEGASGPSIRAMDICTDDSQSECDSHEFPSGSPFSIYVSYEISAALETGNYDFGLELLSVDSHQDVVELLSRRIVTIEHPGTEGSSWVDLACTDEGALTGPDATDTVGKLTVEGVRKFKLVAVAVEEQFRSSPFFIKCVLP